MTKFKKLMALAAVSMLGIQLMGAGTAFANQGGGDGDCDFGSDSLEVTIDMDDVDIWIDGTRLYCDSASGGNGNGGGFNVGGGGNAGDDFAPLSSIDSITVEMDDEEDSEGELWIGLEDTDDSGNASAWPKFDTFDIDVTTEVHVDGSGVGSGSGTTSANNLRIVVGASSVSFSGTTATSNAPAYDIYGGDGRDSIDASKATVKVTAVGDDGDDTIKGGSKNDNLDGEGDEDVVYGNGGNDVLTGDGTEDDECWGGEGNDDILSCLIAAPGAGDDYIEEESTTIVYADLTKGIKWAFGVTGGAAGDDDFEDSDTIVALLGSQGADVLADNGYVDGQGGNDLIKTATDADGGTGNDVIKALDYLYGDSTDTSAVGPNAFNGQGGDDILYGKGGNDELRGGPGKDQTWGGAGTEDYCNGEITNRCEIGRV